MSAGLVTDGPGRVSATTLPAKLGAEKMRRACSRPDIITRRSLENAYTVVLALGGSTNAVLHLMAIAREAEVDLTLETRGRRHVDDLASALRAAGYRVRRH